MSHSMGEVYKRDDVTGELFIAAWFEYNGTVDVALSAMRGSPDEVHARWALGDQKTCSCGMGEPVILYSHYGGGFHWHAHACFTCMAITRNLAPSCDIPGSEYECTDGRPN